MPSVLKEPHPEAAIFSSALWIWPEHLCWDLSNCYALFRKTFHLDRVPSRAPLFITADQAYHLYINGRFVGRGPARGFQHHWPYDEIDVSAHLVPGPNLIAVRAHNPGFSNFQYLTQGYAGLLVAAHWGKFVLNSDASWKAIRQKSISRGTAPASMQLFLQEQIDLRLDPANWMEAGFDDSTWAAPAHCPWNGEPWSSLEPRGTPMLKEDLFHPRALLGLNDGASASGYEQVRDVVELRHREDRSHRPAPKIGFAPLEIEPTGRGKFRSYLFDFGKTVVGNLTFQIEGAQGGEILDTHHTETIDESTLTPDLLIPIHCRMAFGDRLVCRAGKSSHTFFHFYGFRYLCLTVRDVEAPLRLRFHLNAVGYPLERQGSFRSSETNLEKIWEACAWTQQCCSLDAYVDTPWREQAQWWGDARVQARNTFFLSGDTRLFRRGIKQIAAQTTPDGVTYGHAPTIAHSCILPDFTLVWMLTLWDYYWQTGSVEPLLAHHETVQNTLRYFEKHTSPKTGLVSYDNRYWLFLDWNELFKDGDSAVYNLWLLLALEKLALLYAKARQPRESARLKKWAAKLRRSLAPLIGKNGLMRDGFDRRGRIVPTTSIHAQTLAFMAQLKGLDREKIVPILLSAFDDKVAPKDKPSSYWITYVFTLLIDLGHEREVLDFIARRWQPMADYGGTWEAFEPRRGDGSFSHAWSAHPLYHLIEILGGVRQTGPAWSRITFRPLFHGTHADISIPTPRGLIRADWKQKNGKVEVNLRLPKGITAQIELPGLSKQNLRGHRRWLLSGEFLPPDKK